LAHAAFARNFSRKSLREPALHSQNSFQPLIIRAARDTFGHSEIDVAKVFTRRRRHAQLLGLRKPQFASRGLQAGYRRVSAGLEKQGENKGGKTAVILRKSPKWPQSVSKQRE